jgi:hypothetical protein
VLALRRGDRGRARRIAAEAIAVCREHGMGHIGPWVHGVCALVEDDPGARRRWLEQGEQQLALGCVSHNHVQLRELAIDVLLEIGDSAGVERECARIRDYTARESLPMSEFVMARGLALVRFARGERGTDLLAGLRRLRASGAELELNTFLPALDAALGAFDAPGATSAQ